MTTIPIETTSERPVRYAAKSGVLVEHTEADGKGFTGEVAVYIHDSEEPKTLYAEVFRRWDGYFQVDAQANGWGIGGPPKQFTHYGTARTHLLKLVRETIQKANKLP